MTPDDYERAGADLARLIREVTTGFNEVIREAVNTGPDELAAFVAGYSTILMGHMDTETRLRYMVDTIGAMLSLGEADMIMFERACEIRLGVRAVSEQSS